MLDVDVRVKYQTMLYWSCVPGTFVNKLTGAKLNFGSLGPSFIGPDDEWYETLVETLIDLANTMDRKSQSSVNGLITVTPRMRLTCPPRVFGILSRSVAFRAPDPVLNCDTYTLNGDRFELFEDASLPVDEAHIQGSDHVGCVVVLDLDVLNSNQAMA